MWTRFAPGARRHRGTADACESPYPRRRMGRPGSDIVCVGGFMFRFSVITVSISLVMRRGARQEEARL
jgi:hypothetical protein